MSSLRIVVICALALMVLSVATAQVESSSDGSFLDVRTGSVAIPLSALKRPAADLQDSNGQAIDTMQAVQMAERGTDLSRYNPQENKIWQNRVYPVQERPATDYPNGETGVRVLSTEADGLPYAAFYRVQSVDNPNRYWRLGVSLISQSTVIRAAMLRKLGYDVVLPKAYGRLRVHFASVDVKNEFIEDMKNKDMNLESRGWLLENKPDSASLVLADAVIETQRNDSFDWHWGFIQNPRSPDFEERSRALAWVEYMSKYRAYRALIIPFTLAFIPESINRYSVKNVSVINDFAVLYHPLASGFGSATREDIKWLLNRMSRWTEQDFREVVSVAHYPDSVKEMVYRKLVMKAAQTYEGFKLQPPASFPKVDLKYSSADGLFVAGSAVREKVPGYPQRFSHGDRESPFKDDDWFRYAGIRVRSSVIATLLGKMNEKLQVLKLDSKMQNYQANTIQKIRDHIQNRPGQPFESKVQSWGGPLGGFRTNASRQVVTGTYYGSTAAVQLVDNISVAMSLGYFHSFEKMPLPGYSSDGSPILIPQSPSLNLNANVMLQRNYTHVRPLFSMKEATKISWKDVIVPSYMNKLAKSLEKNNMQGFRDFMRDLKEGEVFTITDSLIAGVGGQLLTPMDFLMSMDPLSFISNLTLGADASRVGLRQTSFVRTREGLQVFVRRQTSKAQGVSLDVNYFINLINLRAQGLQSEIKSDAFVIDYSPSWEEDNLTTEQKDKAEEKEKNLRAAVKSLLTSHSTENLYTDFKYSKFELEHLLKTREAKSKVLMYQMIDLKEDHQLTIRPPRSEEDSERNPKEDEVTLFRSRRGMLKGMDMLGFALSSLEALINHKNKKIAINLGSDSDPNPANIPFGKAYWRQVTTEKDLSGRVPDVGIIQHVWGGWHMKRADFMILIDQVIKDLGLPADAKYRLIEKESFHNVKAIDFYKVTANLSLRESALDKIRDLLLQPNSPKLPGEKAVFLARLFQVVDQKVRGTKSRNTDKIIFDDVMRLIGNGDLNQGKIHYGAICEQYHIAKDSQLSGGGTGAWVNGTAFSCMMPWVEKLLTLSLKYPKGNDAESAKQRIRWMTEVVYVLEENIPLPYLLKYLEEPNVLFLVQVNGFRSGDEDGDLTYISNTWGKPNDDFEEANGIFQFYARKSGINSTEIDRTQGSFR